MRGKIVVYESSRQRIMDNRIVQDLEDKEL